MRKISIPLSFLAAMLLASCNYIDEPFQNGGVINPPPTDTVIRKVLVEDFTGHRCKNCPKASKAIEEINTVLPGRMVAVALHAGPSNFTAPDPPVYPTEFRTAEGNALASFFNVSFQPAGMVSRTDYTGSGVGHLKLYTGWAADVSQLSSLEPAFQIKMPLTYNAASRTLSGEVQSIALVAYPNAVHLSLVLCESSIVAPQLLPDDTVDPIYVHNNVFRESLNTAFGELLWTSGANTGDTLSTAISQVLSNDYVAENCKLVAFIYNSATQEVLQAEEVYINDL